MDFKNSNLPSVGDLSDNALALSERRGAYIDVGKVSDRLKLPYATSELEKFERYDLIYRTLCGVLYNFVPTSGHPGGSISCGRFVEALLFDTMDYDLKDPRRKDNDLLCYGAGHKAMGQYAMWALRNEMARAGNPKLLADKTAWQMRFEDLLGFRKNPITPTPLFRQFQSKALDGHAGPNVPFVPTSTGPSGVATAASCGIAFAALDSYPDDPPRVHVIEGEAGMSAGRVLEVLGTAATNRLRNLVFHLDWNQASIDSDKPCREGKTPGDYVQWTPAELAYLNDWNVIFVDDGFDFKKIFAAQAIAENLNTGQPTCIVYRTVKGWRYGIEGAASHGAGHGCCSEAYYNYLKTFEDEFKTTIPRLKGEATGANLEENFWQTLQVFRQVIEENKELHELFAGRLSASRDRLKTKARKPRSNLNLNAVFSSDLIDPTTTPKELELAVKSATTLRGELGRVLNYLNHKSGGSFIGGAADLYASTSLATLNKGFAEGFYNSKDNPESRMISTGGICEDSMGAVMTGISAFGNHVGVGASYAAFLAAFTHVAVRVHCIGQQLKQELEPEPYFPCVMINGHAGVKTGEDGPTHADPQPLQLLQENFVRGTAITLTPWDPAELWPLMAAALRKRPALIAPFVTRPKEVVVDRKALGIAPVEACKEGVYALIKADPKKQPYHGTVVLQGSEAGYAFVTEALTKVREADLNLNVYYVASAELFDLLPQRKQQEIFPSHLANEAMGISGFTLPTLYRWVTSEEGRQHSLYPFKAGHYLGSGKAEMVVKQAGLDGESQFHAILRYAEQFTGGGR